MKNLKRISYTSLLIALSIATTKVILDKTKIDSDTRIITIEENKNDYQVDNSEITDNIITEDVIIDNNDLEELDKKYVALTFDDGPSKYTEELVEFLDKNCVRSTFFVIKSNCKNYPTSLNTIVECGSEIGIHGATHTSFKKLSINSVKKEIEDTYNYIYEDVGICPSTLVRPPYGDINKNILNNVDYPFILWSIDTLDWKSKDKDKIKTIITSNISDGDIILMHDTNAVHKANMAVLEEILPLLKEEGYEFITVSELFEIKEKKIETNKKYTKVK